MKSMRSAFGKLPPLAQNTVWMLLGLVSMAMGQGLNMTLLGRIVGAEALGVYAYAMALVLPVLTACNLGLRSQLLSDVHNKHAFGHYEALRILGGATGVAIMLGLIAVLHLPAITAMVVLLLTLARTAEFYADLGYGHWQKLEQHKRIAFSTCWRSLAGVVGMGVCLLAFHTLLAGVGGLVLGWLAVVVLYDVRMVRKLVPVQERKVRRWNWPSLKPLLWQGIPLAFSSMVNSTNTSLPRLFLANHQGMEELGKLAVYLYGIQILLMVVQAVGHALGPRMAKYYQTDSTPDRFTRLWTCGFIVTIAMGLTTTTVLTFFGDILVSKFFGPQFIILNSFGSLLGASSVIVLSTALVGFFLTSVRAFWMQLPLQTVSLASTYLLCWWLLPIGGVQNIPLVLFGSATISLLGMSATIAIYLHKQFKGRNQ